MIFGGVGKGGRYFTLREIDGGRGSEFLAGLDQRLAAFADERRQCAWKACIALAQTVRAAVRLDCQSDAARVLETDEPHGDASSCLFA